MIKLVENMPLWYYIVGNIGAFVIMIITFIVAIFADIISDDIDFTEAWDEYKIVITILGVGMFAAFFWMAAWPLFSIILIPVIIMGIRRIANKIREFIFYWRYER